MLIALGMGWTTSEDYAGLDVKNSRKREREVSLEPATPQATTLVRLSIDAFSLSISLRPFRHPFIRSALFHNIVHDPL